MASQPVSSSNVCEYNLNSYVRGYHAYKHCWDRPWIGEILPLEGTLPTTQDKFPVQRNVEVCLVTRMFLDSKGHLEKQLRLHQPWIRVAYFYISTLSAR